MNFVEPIRNLGQLHDIEDWLKKYNVKYFIMFEVGVYSGLRISDILPLRVEDVWHKTHIKVREKKTGKYKAFIINPELKAVLDPYCKGRRQGEFLVPSDEKFPRQKPVSKKRAYQVLRRAGEENKLPGLGTHSMRKTFGYHYYKKYKDVAELMRLFNHSAPSVTLRYIGIEQDGLDRHMTGFSLRGCD
jgi:integrase